MLRTELKPRKSWFRFSLRTFLIVVTLLSVVIGWKLERVRRQREAVKWITAQHRFVVYDYGQFGRISPSDPNGYPVASGAVGRLTRGSRLMPRKDSEAVPYTLHDDPDPRRRGRPRYRQPARPLSAKGRI